VTVKFDTRDYRLSHLQEPRGRGSWAFALDMDKVERGVYDDDTLWSPSMTYTEARKWARQEITRRLLAAGRLLPRQVTLFVLA
jgi:hypothetical protein